MKLTVSRSSASCDQRAWWWRCTQVAQPLPRCVQSLAPDSTAAAIRAGTGRGMPDRSVNADRRSQTIDEARAIRATPGPASRAGCDPQRSLLEAAELVEVRGARRARVGGHPGSRPRARCAALPGGCRGWRRRRRGRCRTPGRWCVGRGVIVSGAEVITVAKNCRRLRVRQRHRRPAARRATVSVAEVKSMPRWPLIWGSNQPGPSHCRTGGGRSG